MKQVFKPLGIATAVAAASASFVNVASAQPTVANNALGDLALVPYYTVSDDWITGIHIVNQTDKTQVVKFRFRRALDSMDALDFNIVMSPKDVYAGALRDDGDTIFWSANDTTCTVPATTNGRLTMPEIYREGAETGYVEIIAMGQPTTESNSIGEVAKHSGTTGDPALTPKSCEMVRGNFFADGVDGSRQGVIDFQSTTMEDDLDIDGDDDTDYILTTYEDSDNEALKVSYFIRDNATGVEFGDNAVHVQGFLEEPTMTNQQFGWFAGDLDGFDFPDLNGGSPVDGSRDRYEMLRAGDVLGVTEVLNEWTANPDNGAALDWVVTLPGQYTQLHQPGYVAALTGAPVECVRVSDPAGKLPEDVTAADLDGATASSPVEVFCDYRDLPVTASISAWNREEFAGVRPDEDLVVSPAPPGSNPVLKLEKEVNVIGFGGQSVLGVVDTDISASLGQNFGWLTLAVTPASGNGLCLWNADTDTDYTEASARNAFEILAQKSCEEGIEGSTPIIGFAAWERSVAANPDASYGRIVGHSSIRSAGDAPAM